MRAMILLLILPLCCFVPGFFLLRRVRWSKAEILSASVGLSLILIYLVMTIVYLANVNPRWVWGASAICAVLMLLCSSDLGRFLRRGIVRRQLLGFGLFFLLGLFLLCTMRHYSGGDWVSDWLGHYQRTTYFLHQQPYDAHLFQPDPIPSRPPMMNLIAAYFLAHVGFDFHLFQITFLFLNLLAVLPCMLLMGVLMRHAGRHIPLLLGLLALNPMVLQNATWAWTKLLTAFFVLLGLAFYLRGWRLNSSARIVAAAISLGAGILVHYSAIPYALPIGLHYLSIFPNRRAKLREVSISLLAGVTLLATWFGWAVVAFGMHQTFNSNTTVADSQKLSAAENVLKILGNFVHTVLPHPFFTSSPFPADFFQPSLWGYLRDYYFLMYQTNLLLSFGLLGWIGVLWVTTLLWRRVDRSSRRFWIFFTLTATVLGIAVHGAGVPYGIAQVCLQPIILLGVVALACGFSLLPDYARKGLVAFLLVDALLGILLHFRMQMESIAFVPTAAFPIVPLSDRLPSLYAVLDSVMQHQHGFLLLGDRLESVGRLALILSSALLGFFFVGPARTAWPTLQRAGFARQLFAPLLLSTLSIVLLIFHPVRRSLGLQGTASDSLAGSKYQSGVNSYSLGQLDPASADLSDAMLLDPTDLRTRYVLQILLVPHGKTLADTDARFAELVRLHPDDELARKRLEIRLRARGLDTNSLKNRNLLGLSTP